MIKHINDLDLADNTEHTANGKKFLNNRLQRIKCDQTKYVIAIFYKQTDECFKIDNHALLRCIQFVVSGL